MTDASAAAEHGGPIPAEAPASRPKGSIGGEPLPKVVYLAGWGRSGTTILANILGQLEGFVSVGELHYIWTRGFHGEWLCGCGAPLPSCQYWTDAFDVGFGGRPQIDLEEVLSAKQCVRIRSLLKLWYLSRLQRPGRYGEALARMYRGAAAAAAASVVVDSSKSPADAIVASSIADLDLFIVHLVRDPRAVAFSWSRHTRPAGQEQLERIGWFTSTAKWLGFNLATEWIVRSAVRGRYMRVRYEDFVARPRETVKSIVLRTGGIAGAEGDEGPFVGADKVRLEPAHTASGNPSRFATGVIPIHADDEWIAAMPRRRRIAVTLLAAPLMKKYGYGLFSERLG